MPNSKIPESLTSWFSECPYALTAFSGGVDSSLVAWLANHLLPERNLSVISASPSLKLSELDHAKQFAFEHKIPIKVVVTREMENESYLENPANRCFFCKQTLYTELKDLAKDLTSEMGMRDCWLLNGTNTDDLGDYRPGLEAAKNFQVRSPLAECGLNKTQVRELAADLGLSCWDKPASPCLSSRIPYGLRVTPEKLRRIERAEAWLQESGFPVCRVRHLEGTARVEVPPEDLERLHEIESAMRLQFKHFGFLEIEIDPEGFVSGKLNRALTSPATSPATAPAPPPRLDSFPKFHKPSFS